MSSEDIYKRTFDESVPTSESHPNSGCPDCGGLVQTNTVETYCDDCGLVIDDTPVDHGPEWRSFGEEDNARVGAPRTVARHDRGLSTEIGWERDGYGAPLSDRKRKRLGRIRKQHDRAKFRSKAERNQASAFGHIKRVCTAMGLKRSHRNQACQLFRSAQEANLIRGRSIESMVGGCVYAVGRLNGLGRPLGAVSAVLPVETGRVENAYDVLNRELNLPSPPPHPRDHLPRIVSELGLSARARREAAALIDRAVEAGCANGRNPAGVAAGAVCVVGQGRDKRPQRLVAEVAGVSVMTARKRRDELRTEFGV